MIYICRSKMKNFNQTHHHFLPIGKLWWYCI